MQSVVYYFLMCSYFRYQKRILTNLHVNENVYKATEIN